MKSVASRPLTAREYFLPLAIGFSVLAHAVLLVLPFVAPEAFRQKPDHGLEVVLVNAKSKTKPVKADAIAQVDLNGGGENDAGRAKSFLPVSAENSDGDVLKESQGAVAKLEADQKKLLSQLKQTPVAVDPDPPPKTDTQNQKADFSDPELLKQIARREAELAKQIEDYNKRPKRGYIAPNTKAASYATYYMQYKDKVERMGTANYPAEARGRIYGKVRVEVTINPDGTIYNNEITILESSGYPVLDRAAKRIVRMSAPFGRFSPEMRRDNEIYEIVSVFEFVKGDMTRLAQ